MNNTKWREVLDVVGKLHMPVQFAFVGEEKFMNTCFFPEDGCTKVATKDCCLHGPFYLREIYAIRCPINEIKQDSETGSKYKGQRRSQCFLSELKKIGQLPLEKNDEYIIIRGYQK